MSLRNTLKVMEPLCAKVSAVIETSVQALVLDSGQHKAPMFSMIRITDN